LSAAPTVLCSRHLSRPLNVICLGTVSRWEHIGRCLRKAIRKSQVPRRFIGFVQGRERDLVAIPVDKVEGTHALNLLCQGKERMVSFKTNPTSMRW